MHPVIYDNYFQDCDWEDFYRDDSEEIPGNKTMPRGSCISEQLFVDSNHDGDTKKRQSQTGILLLCNRVMITHLNKSHNSV